MKMNEIRQRATNTPHTTTKGTLPQRKPGIDTNILPAAVATNLLLCIVIIYGLFSLFQSKTGKGKLISALVILACLCGLGYKYATLDPNGIGIEAPIFQQFNPCFVVGLTPISMAIFAWLAKKGKEPSAPRKIGYGRKVGR
jgi:proton-dependent oligopeptide transporter, POT family